MGLSVGRGHGCQRARAQEGSRQGHGAPDGSPVPTCCQPSALLSPLTLRIVTTVTAPPSHTHTSDSSRAPWVPSKTVKKHTSVVLSHQVTAATRHQHSEERLGGRGSSRRWVAPLTCLGVQVERQPCRVLRLPVKFAESPPGHREIRGHVCWGREPPPVHQDPPGTPCLQWASRLNSRTRETHTRPRLHPPGSQTLFP